MYFNTRDIQARLNALATVKPSQFPLLIVDGMWGKKTDIRLREAYSDFGVSKTPDLFSPTGVHRIHWHWTGGSHTPSAYDLKHYNLVIAGNGDTYETQHRPEHQANYVAGSVGASHTLNANTGAIGIAIACGRGSRESPFSAGTDPITDKQIDSMIRATALYSKIFDIPVSMYSIMSHAEVQENLGIKQRYKWDITYLPDLLKINKASYIGDTLRRRVYDELQK